MWNSPMHLLVVLVFLGVVLFLIPWLILQARQEGWRSAGVHSWLQRRAGEQILSEELSCLGNSIKDACAAIQKAQASLKK